MPKSRQPKGGDAETGHADNRILIGSCPVMVGMWFGVVLTGCVCSLIGKNSLSLNHLLLVTCSGGAGYGVAQLVSGKTCLLVGIFVV